MNRLFKNVLFALFFVGCLSISAYGQNEREIIYLKDGSTILGNVIAQDDSTLVVETAYGILEIRKVRVVKRESAKEEAQGSPPKEMQTLRLKDGTIVKGVVHTESQDSITIETSYGIMKIPRSNIINHQMKDIGTVEANPIPTDTAYTTAQYQASLSPSQQVLRRSFEIIAGLSIPTGDFNSSTGEKAGLATTGFSLGVQFASEVSQNLELGVIGLVSYHGVDKEEAEGQFGSLLPGANLEVGHWLLIWLMGGIGFNIPISPSANFYGRGLLGVLVGRSPEFSATYWEIKATLNPAMALAAGYGFDVGVIINRVNIGFRLLAAEPEYKVTGKAEGYGQQYTDTFNIRQPTSAIQLTIGISLK